MELELIKYNENLPFKIHIFEAQNREYHLHKEIELVFVLKGSVVYEVKGKKYRLLEQDLFLVNRLEVHSVLSEKKENILLVLQLDPNYFNQYFPDFSDSYFNPENSFNDRSSSLYENISYNLAQIMMSLIKQSSGYKLEAVNSVIEIALSLVQKCRTGLRQQTGNEIYKQNRISELLKYIDENYTSDLSLDAISREMLISPQYISKFFKNNLGVGFVDYINKLRITKSLNDLLGSKKSIIDIAVEHGFNDHKAYNRVFKKEFGMTPTEYRNKASAVPVYDTAAVQSDYFNNNSRDYFKYLFEFLQKDMDMSSNVEGTSEKLNINTDLTKPVGKSLTKYWRKITSVGRAALCLRSEIQGQIRLVQKELGYEYIRFHGIFSDEMLVYREDSSGNPVYNWNYIDQIFDFFQEVKLRPFIEIGFMPEALASKKQFNPFFWRANVSYPKSIKKWSNLVSEFIRHCIERYGKDEVEKWYFEIWNAPDIPNLFWYEGKESFFDFYKETYFSMKKVWSRLRIGTPGFTPMNNFQWLADFLNYCRDNSIVLSFVSCHVYANTDPQNKTILSKLINTSSINFSLSDENFLHDAVNLMKKILEDMDLNSLELFVTEWNLSPYTVDYTRDTSFLSTYIVHSLLSNLGTIDGLAFWSLSDIMEEGITEDKLFHGGLGLFTCNSLKKPSYNAFYLLSKLGNHIAEVGEDYIITSKDNRYQVLLYNFVYFDEFFRTGDKSLLSYHERYNIFKAAGEKAVNIILNLEEGKYKIKKTSLNRESGSTFDAWLKIGAPEDIQSDVYSYLKSSEVPEISISTVTVKGQLVLSDTVPVHGMLLIEIDRLG